MVKPLVLALALAAAGAYAQAPAPAASAPKPVSAAKKALVNKVLQLQQPGIESLARQLAEQPAAQMLQQSGMALQRLPAEKREQVAKDMQADARKYAEEAVPVVRASAVKLAPQTIGALLEEKFSEDELKQVIAMLESPVVKKFQGLQPDMQRALTEKVVGDSRAQVEPKVRALEQQLVQRLQAQAPQAPASTPKQ
jgi:uncharacterized protein